MLHPVPSCSQTFGANTSKYAEMIENDRRRRISHSDRRDHPENRRSVLTRIQAFSAFVSITGLQRKLDDTGKWWDGGRKCRSIVLWRWSPAAGRIVSLNDTENYDRTDTLTWSLGVITVSKRVEENLLKHIVAKVDTEQRKPCSRNKVFPPQRLSFLVQF